MPDQRPSPTLSIIIVSWNTRQLLLQCLASIEQEGLPDLETIVVDNASHDGSAAAVRASYPGVTVIESWSNLGFAGANNAGILASHGRFILLLNPDTEIRPGALFTLLDFMATQPEAGAAGARLLNPDGSLQTSCFPTPTLAGEFWRQLHLDWFVTFGVYDMSRWDPATPRRVDVLLGACILLRREALEQVGLMDTGYFMYTEETDLCYRLGQAGWSLYWVPQAEIVHYGGQSTRQVAGDMFMKLYASKIRFFRKHYGRWNARWYKLILLLSVAPRLALSPLARLTPPPRREQYQRLTGFYQQLVRALPSL